MKFSIMRKLKSLQSSKTEQDKISRPVAEVVAEIHETFYTEVDRLLESSKQLNLIQSPIQDQLDKSKLLWELGFNACKEVVTTQDEHVRISRLEKENYEKDKLQRAINYFSLKYPNYKFITEESVSKICQKYGLIYGPAALYVGSIPNKNIIDMRNFSISEEDKAMIVNLDHAYSYSIYYISGRDHHYHNDGQFRNGLYVSVDELKLTIDEHKEKDLEAGSTPWGRHAPFEIAAPSSDFDQKYHKVVGNQLVANYPDPVVLQPIIFEGKKHYLIVTAWGQEASDELVINEKMN